MPKQKLRLALITTARSDYSTMHPVIELATHDPDIEALVFCSGMHLLKEFGETYRQLEHDGYTISEKIDFFVTDDRPDAFARSLARGTELFAMGFLQQRPDIIVVSGDRLENLAILAAATALKIPVAHMCGGDITEGAFDNQVRHAMTKLSHLHFASMDEHAQRILQMGEEPWRIVITGDAAIDTIANFRAPDRASVASALGVSESRELAISTFHPATLGVENSILQYRNILRVLAEFDGIPVISYPNVDPGYQALIQLLDEFRDRRPDAVVRESFGRDLYYSLLAHCTFMIGNSSSGIWEAPSFALPAVNIGQRQAGRRRGRNVIDVNGIDLIELREAVATGRSSEFRDSLKGMTNPYGSGRAAPSILSALKAAPLGDRLMIKKFYELRPSLEGLGIERS